ncbi:PREDICTED: sodium bicarbonate cotransporter 3-like [Phaethon lepturus]|uniref:sodium bicarbonate cotransporter 3-like n=1 Tax=Phaethon lepturus TaxID=97097 RepID=UPI000530A98E|nr:PREDICTED: sodium bicarbonate cotransporter 3-like [Phaethon lepturus]
MRGDWRGRDWLRGRGAASRSTCVSSGASSRSHVRAAADLLGGSLQGLAQGHSPLLHTSMEEARPGKKMQPGHDEEAVVDMGKISSTINTNFEKEELESHRAVYIGVHVPFGKQGRRRHRHRGHRHHRRKKERETDREDGRESPSYDTPSQRVQFILGTEDDDEHIPHDLFTEMDELCFRDGEEYEWKETARWLKFEEDVEDGGDRWSKPYVATLSLHSLFELRSCILNGTVMLDMRANTLDEIADMVLDNMIASGQLDESIRENVREALLKRHHHQNEKKFSNRIPLVRSFADIGKKHSDPHLLERNGILSAPPSWIVGEASSILKEAAIQGKVFVVNGRNGIAEPSSGSANGRSWNPGSLKVYNPCNYPSKHTTLQSYLQPPANYKCPAKSTSGQGIAGVTCQ